MLGPALSEASMPVHEQSSSMQLRLVPSGALQCLSGIQQWDTELDLRILLVTLQNSVALVTGTLGLSFPKTAAAMRKAVSYARSGPCSVLVDINWRPVFWESLSHKAVQIVSEYAGGADILKLSEEEAEWLYGVHPDQAMNQPELVSLQGLFPEKA